MTTLENQSNDQQAAMENFANSDITTSTGTDIIPGATTVVSASDDGDDQSASAASGNNDPANDDILAAAAEEGNANDDVIVNGDTLEDDNNAHRENTATGNISDEPKHPNQQEVDQHQPSIVDLIDHQPAILSSQQQQQHSSLPQAAQLSSSESSHDPLPTTQQPIFPPEKDFTPPSSSIHNSNNNSHRNNEAQAATPPQDNATTIKRPNYHTSAPISVLGNNSDKNDFCRGAAVVPPSSLLTASNDDDDQRRGSSPIIALSEKDGGNTTTALTKLKQWFSTTTTTAPSSPPTAGIHDEEHGHPTESSTIAHEYHNFSPPKSEKKKSVGDGGAASKSPPPATESVRKISLDDYGFDESLLDEEEKDEGDAEVGRRKRRAWGKPSSTSGTAAEEEERVMGECSFFYDMDKINEDEIAATATTTPDSGLRHRTPGTDPPPTQEDDDESEGYFEQQRPHYQNRRVLHPRAMAHAIRTRAKRRWTERRYRRRLRQSQLGLPRHSWSKHRTPNADDDDNDSQAEADEFAYELTTEHRQAFNAAHAALNGKIADEYSRNRHAIRKQEFGYDVDHDLDLEEEDAGGNGAKEIRADLTKSSLAIRGGLIRTPTDNVRLVSDQQLQPGILSIETRDVQEVKGGEDGIHGGGGTRGYENYGNANRYGNIHGNGMVLSNRERNKKEQRQRRPRNSSNPSESLSSEQLWSRHELAYVLTVDEHIYQRVVQEMGDSYRIPCGMYYCCHDSESGDHVGIGVAVVVLLGVFFLMVWGMIAWPNW